MFISKWEIHHFSTKHFYNCWKSCFILFKVKIRSYWGLASFSTFHISMLKRCRILKIGIFWSVSVLTLFDATNWFSVIFLFWPRHGGRQKNEKFQPSKRIKAFRVSRESDCMAQTEWWFLMSSCDLFLPMINSNSDVNHFSKASWRWWFSTISIVISIFRLIVSELTIHFFSKSTFFPIFLEKKLSIEPIR